MQNHWSGMDAISKGIRISSRDDFEESKHPRDKSGQFSSGGSGGAGRSLKANPHPGIGEGGPSGQGTYRGAGGKVFGTHQAATASQNREKREQAAQGEKGGTSGPGGGQKAQTGQRGAAQGGKIPTYYSKALGKKVTVPEKEPSPTHQEEATARGTRESARAHNRRIDRLTQMAPTEEMRRAIPKAGQPGYKVPEK